MATPPSRIIQSSAYGTPEEQAAFAAQVERDRMMQLTEFDRGLRRGLYNVPALGGWAAGQVLEPFSPDMADGAFEFARGLNKKAAVLPRSVESYTDVKGLGTALDYMTGLAAESLPLVLAAAPAAIAARGATALQGMSPLARTFVGETAGMAPMMLGDAAQTLQNDPDALANTTPEERLALSAGYSAITSPAAAIPGALLTNRALGTGAVLKNVVNDGFGAAAKDAGKHLAKSVPEALVTEGLTEGFEEYAKQQMHGIANPNRDDSDDVQNLKEAVIAGFAGGLPMSAAGRGMDAVHSNARALTDAAREKLAKILEPKKLPKELANSDEETILGWDAADEQSRNEAAAQAAQEMADDVTFGSRVKEWMAKAKEGAADWKDFAPIAAAKQKYDEANKGVERFFDAVKNAYEMDGKKNDEFTDDDKLIHQSLVDHMDPENPLAQDEARTAALYGYLKQVLANNDADIPIHALENVFGGEKQLRSALSDMREMMSRAGMVDHDETYSDTLATRLADGKTRDLAMSKLIKSHLKLQYGDEISPHDAVSIAKGIEKGLEQYPSKSKEWQAKFDERVNELFGKNSEKVLDALGLKRPEAEQRVVEDTIDEEGQPNPAFQTIHDAPGDALRFVGSATKRKGLDTSNPDNGRDDHGGFWRLDTVDPKGRSEIRARYDQTIHALKGDPANIVHQLTPEQYAEKAGVSKEEVAKRLNTTVEKLANHPARMISIETKTMDNDSIDLTSDDIVRLAKGGTNKAGATRQATVTSLRERVNLSTAQKVREALKLQGGEQRKALREAGYPNAESVETTKSGLIVVSNLNHGGEGRFTVHMRDGTEHVMSAQELIHEMRQRNETNPTVKGLPGGDADLLRNFAQGVSSLVNNPDVRGITVNDVWGRKRSRESTQKERPVRTDIKEKQDQANKAQSDILGTFGRYFKLNEGVTLGQASSRQVRGEVRREYDREKDIKEREAELEQLDLDKMSHDDLYDQIENLEFEIEQRLADGKGVSRLEKQLERLQDKLDDLSYDENMHDAEVDALTALTKDPEQSVTVDEIRENTKDISRSLQEDGVKNARTFDEQGQPLHPTGSDRRSAGKDGPSTERALNNNRMAMLLERGVGKQHFTSDMVSIEKDIDALFEAADGSFSNALNTALSKLAKAAKAVRDGDKLSMRENLAKVVDHLVNVTRGMLYHVSEKGQQDSEADKAALKEEYANIKAFHEKYLQKKDILSAEKDIDTLLSFADEETSNELEALKKDFNKLAKQPTKEKLEKLEKDLASIAKSMMDATAEKGRRAVEADKNVFREEYASIKAIHENHTTGTLKNEEASARGTESATPEQQQSVKDYINKVLGPKVHVEFVKMLKGLDGKFTSGSAQWFQKNGEAFIQIVHNAINPMSKAHHEAMHEMFQRLSEAHPDAASVLSRAASSASVIRQIEQFFHNEPNRDKIMEQIKSSEHERVAYMYQLWAAGELKVGPKTENIFTKVMNFLRKALGILSNDQKAEAIMQAFHDGKLREPSEVGKVLAKDVKRRDEAFADARKKMNSAYEEMMHWVGTTSGHLVGNENPHLDSIGKKMYNVTGDKGELGFILARDQKTNQMVNRLASILEGADKKDLELVLEYLQRGESPKDEKLKQIYDRVHTMLNQVYDYLDRSGTGIGKIKENYFPRVWDMTTLSEKRDEFLKDLLSEHGDVMKDLVKKHNAKIERKINALKRDIAKDSSDSEVKLEKIKELEATLATPEDMAEAILNTLLENKGSDPIKENEWRVGYTPFMQSANERSLKFINNKVFAKYYSKDLVNTLSTYLSQAAHTGEYTKRFGRDGSEIRKELEDALMWEAVRYAEQKTGKTGLREEAEKAARKAREESKRGGHLFPDQRGFYDEMIDHLAKVSGEGRSEFLNRHRKKLNNAKRNIMAMEGTLGHDIGETFRKVQSAAITYQNIRLLPFSLFSQFIDSIGQVVNGGDLNDAFRTFKRGIEGVVHGWKGTRPGDEMSKLARTIGINDSHALLNSMGSLYSSIYMGRTAKKWNDAFFRWNGVEMFTQQVRVGAMETGIRLIADHLSKPNKDSKRFLEELGLDPSKKDEYLSGDELNYSNEAVQSALMRFVNNSVVRPNAANRPAWGSDPRAAIFFHMKGFTYAFHKTILEKMAHEAKHGNYDPVMTALLAYIPVMITADIVKGMLMTGGGEPEYKRRWGIGDYFTEGVQRAGLLGIPQFAVDTAKWGPAALGGPMVEQAAKAVRTGNKQLEQNARLKETNQARYEADNPLLDTAKHVGKDALPINQVSKRVLLGNHIEDSSKIGLHAATY